MQPTSTLIIVNPAAAHGHAADDWQQLEQTARAIGGNPSTVLTKRSGHATSLARDAADRGTDRILAVGGDGTICEIVNGLMQVDPKRRLATELALVRRGSGCDTARTFQIPRDPNAALEIAFHGRLQTIDLGLARVTHPDGARQRYFVTIASAGLTADVAARVARSSKPLGGRVAYAWAALMAFRGYHNTTQRIDVDETSQELVTNNVIVGNGGLFAGGMNVLPDACVNDGLLDVLVWGDVSLRDYVGILPRLYRGTHTGHPAATFLRGRQVAVQGPVPLGVEVDGEVLGTTPAMFTVAPSAIHLRVDDTTRATADSHVPPRAL